MCSVILTRQVCDGWPERGQEIVGRKGIMLALGIQDSFIQCEIFHFNAPLWFSQRMCRFSFKSEERKVGTVMGASRGRREAFSVVWELQHVFPWRGSRAFYRTALADNVGLGRPSGFLLRSWNSSPLIPRTQGQPSLILEPFPQFWDSRGTWHTCFTLLTH